jgi:hypothetical protein
MTRRVKPFFKESAMKRSPVWTPATVVALVLGLLACATTTFDSTWRAPDARPLQLTGKKVAGLVISKNEALRRSAEDAMAREISAHGAQARPPPSTPRNQGSEGSGQAESRASPGSS